MSRVSRPWATTERLSIIRIGVTALKKKLSCLRCAALLGTAAVLTPLAMLFPGGSTKRQRAPFQGMNFAHRGLHSRDKTVPENSLEAFRLAARAGYGIELDVRLSRDGQVVV